MQRTPEQIRRLLDFACFLIKNNSYQCRSTLCKTIPNQEHCLLCADGCLAEFYRLETGKGCWVSHVESSIKSFYYKDPMVISDVDDEKTIIAKSRWTISAPPSILAWAGLGLENRLTYKGNPMHTLMSLNDIERLTLSEIAGVIRENTEGERKSN